MSNSKVNVAVVTPFYNYGKYFDEYVDGIFKQTYKPKDVFLVDDCSTDDSFNIIAKYIDDNGGKETFVGSIDSVDVAFSSKEKIHGIKFHLLHSKENKGPSHARNIAIKLTLGQPRYNPNIYAMYDMDDVYYADKIYKSIEIMHKFKQVGLVYSDYNTKNTKTGDLKREYKEPFSYERLLQECIVSTNSVIAASIFEKSGIYDESLRVAEDYDLWLRIAEHCMIYHLPEPLFEYRITGEGATFSVDNETWQKCWQRVKEKTMERHAAK